MSTNQTQEPNQLAVREVKAAMPMVSRGITFDNFESLWRFASVVSKSGLAPKGIQTPEAIAIAVQMALEVGLSPMAGLQNIAVINGRPSIWGDAQLAIVRASGELVAFEESETNNALDPVFRELCLEDDQSKRKALRIQLAKAQSAINRTADDFGVTVFVRRKDFEPMFARFTVADAKAAGLWTKEGPWKQYPARMLKHRARSFALRDQFGDALKGMLSSEEAGDLPSAREKPVFATIVASSEQAQLTPTHSNETKGVQLTILQDWMRKVGVEWSALQPLVLEHVPESKADVATVEELTEEQCRLIRAARALEAAIGEGK